MKKILIISIVLVLIVVGALFIPSEQDYDYLRIHIRANSNLTIDQNVKYEVKANVVEYLTPFLCNVPSKEEAISIINENINNIEMICDNTLKTNGFNYISKVKINNEFFPTRTYDGTTLESGYYDAVIIELGDAIGDNWWCVMYPPLCFVNKFENNIQIKYKSKIVEWFKNIFG